MIAGSGFAMMAWRAARTRVGLQPNFGHPLSRERANDPDMFNPASREYYRIIDAAWARRNASRVRF